MRNYFFYILFICVFTNSFGQKNEDKKKSAGEEPFKKTRVTFEQEAKKDTRTLLSSVKNHNLSEEEREPFDVSARSSKLMERIDKSLIKSKNKKNLRTIAQINAGNFRRRVYGFQNLPLNLRDAIESINLHNSDAQLLNRNQPNGGIIKNRISWGYNDNTMLRNTVNYVNIKPEVYPLYITDEKYGSRETAAEKGIVEINHEYYTNDDDKLPQLVNEIDTNHKNETFIRTASIPMSENFDLEGLLNKLRIKQEEISTTKESEPNTRYHDFLNKVYDRSNNHYQLPGNRVEKVKNNLDELDNIDSEHRDHSKTILLRSDVVDDVNSNANERLNKLMKYMENGKKILRNRRNALFQDSRPARHGDHRSRHRRASGTQAGYTQDPDTCKTYNENLGKLWSNLSKLINTEEQPNDRDLHNIAMMIQAYLQHKNAKQPPETHITEHEGPMDEISEIIHRIRKLLGGAEGSAEKITQIILKYLRPDYNVVESEDCQKVNEEFLTLSVDLLYKNYLEKTDCQGEDDGISKNKKVIVRQRFRPPGITNNGDKTLLLGTSDLKPHLQNLFTESELYKEFRKGKKKRLGRPIKNRRVFKPSRQQRSRPADRSGSSSKSVSKKQKKSFLKSDVQKSRCEMYAIRKLEVSLRPVMERFNGLLECQLDETLRSVSLSRDLEYSYQRYASEFYSNENIGRDRKVSPRFPVRNTGRKRNKSHKKIYKGRHGSSFENDYDAPARDHDDETDFAWLRKYSFDKSKITNSKAYAEARDAQVSETHTRSNKDYVNENLQSPPSYGDYVEVYKTQQNAFPTFINPSVSLNDKTNTPSLSRNKQNRGIAENENYYEYEDLAFYGDSSISEEMNDVSQETVISTKITPFLNFTKLRSDEQLIEEKNNTFESITEFLKRARDESLKTPEFAVPFALDTNKGYVELTHLIKYPKTLVYRPQFLVKNTMPYDDFLKTFNNSNMTNDDVTLMKMVRHLPNGSVQVLFETEDSEELLEIWNLNDKDNRRSRSSDPVVDYQSESRINNETANKNNNADLTDGNREGFSLNYRNGSHRQDFKSPLISDSSSSDEYLSPDLVLNIDLGTLRGNEELFQNSYFVNNSDTNKTSNSTPNSLESRSSWFSRDVSKEKSSAVATQKGTGIQIGSGNGTQMGLDTPLNSGLKLNPMRPSQLGSLFSKLMPSHSNAQATPKPSLNSQSHMNSHFDSSSGSYSASNSHSHLNSHSGSWSGSSHSLLPNNDSNNQEVGKNVSSSYLSIAQWWRMWKSIIKEKMKKIIGRMGNFTRSYDRIVNP